MLYCCPMLSCYPLPSLAKAVCIMAILRVRAILVLVEQPKSSVMFLLNVWEELGRQFQFSHVWTWMGCFNHFMEKPSCLYGNLRFLPWFLGNREKMGKGRKRNEKEVSRYFKTG